MADLVIPMKRGAHPALWAAAVLAAATGAVAFSRQSPVRSRASGSVAIDHQKLPDAPGSRWSYAGTWNETLTLEVAEGPRSLTETKRGTETRKIDGEDRITFPVPTIITQSNFTEKSSKGPPRVMTWQSYSRRTPEGVYAYGYKHGDGSGPFSGKLTRNLKPTLTLKLPLMPGMKWPVGTEAAADGLQTASTAEVSGPETVRVPAGTFRNCLKVTYRITALRGTTTFAQGRKEVGEGNGVQTAWIAPGVGMVKEVRALRLRMTFHPQNGSTPLPGTTESRSTRELTSFQIANPRRTNVFPVSPRTWLLNAAWRPWGKGIRHPTRKLSQDAGSS